MFKFLPLVALSLTGAFASQFKPLLAARELVQIPCSQQGLKTCGQGCIALTATCCPDGSGGCPVGQYCVLGDNKQYGCCQDGETCVGAGGASTSDSTLTVTNTLTNTIVSTIVHTLSTPSSTYSVPPPPPPSSTYSVPPPPPSTAAASTSAAAPITVSSIIPPPSQTPSTVTNTSATGVPVVPPNAAACNGFSAAMLAGILAGTGLLLL